MKPRFILLLSMAVSVVTIGIALVHWSRSDAIGATNRISRINAFFDTTMIRPEQGQKYFLEEYRKLTGIELHIIQPPHNQYYEKLLIAFACNDLPDIAELDQDRYLQFAAEGAIVPLNDILAQSAIVKRMDKVYINGLRLRDGNIYGFPLDQGGGCVTYLRKDWLDSLRIKIPKTYDELYEVMKAFTFKDPNQNGRDDTGGYTLPGLGNDIYMRDFYQDATHAFTYSNGRWIDGFMQPNYRPALERLRRAFQDGILDREVFTNQTSTSREKFYAGKFGVFCYWSGTWGKVIDDNVKAGCGPKADTVAIPAIRGSFYYNNISTILGITKACRNPDAVYRNIIELMYDGGRGQMLFTHGVEGLHWKRRSGKYVKLPSPANKNQVFGKVFIHPDLALAKWNDPFVLDKKAVDSRRINLQTVRQMKLLPMSEAYLKSGAEVAALKEDIIARVILGKMTADEGLRLYRERSAALGVAKMLAEFNQ